MKNIFPVLFALLFLTACGQAEEFTESVPVEITETKSIPEEYAVIYDVQLRTTQKEFLVDQDEHEIIWYAEIPVDYQPEIVYLVDADTGEIAAELFDESDYEKYGDTIKGDSVYNCRFIVNTDIDTNPEVSEEVDYHYYAEFTVSNVHHRSETVDIWVAEPFTDKELDDMEAVDNAVSQLMQSDTYQNASDEEKYAQAVALLEELAAQGTPDRPYSLIIPESIIQEETISFQYACGVGGGIMPKPFDPQMN